LIKLSYIFLFFLPFKQDEGRPSLTGTAYLTIRIKDEQDMPPFFQGLPYRETLLENTEIVRSCVFKI